MIITDTHTHLYSKQFDEDRQEVMKRAIDNGVLRFFIPAIDSSCSEAMFTLEKDFSEHVYLMMGLHPTSVKENYLEELLFVKEWLDKRSFYAVGEIGIDLYWDTTFLQQQQDAFKNQAQKAISYKMKLGIGGVVTFKKGGIDQFLNEIPINNIVLETDSPYLAPVPYRGKRNESSYITNVLDKLVDIYNLTPQEIASITTQNSKDIFGI